MSDISMVPESTLPETSSEEREREDRPEVLVPATQRVQVAVRMADEVHDIREDVRQLATRFDGLEERFDGLERRYDEGGRRIAESFAAMRERTDESDRRIDGRFDTIKEWTDGFAGMLQTILGQLAEIRSSIKAAEEERKRENGIRGNSTGRIPQNIVKWHEQVTLGPP